MCFTALCAQAQQKLPTFSVSDKEQIAAFSDQKIRIASPAINLLSKEVTITLTNQSGSNLKSGDLFSLVLPRQDGYEYDLSKLKLDIGTQSPPSITYKLKIEDSFTAGSSVALKFNLIKRNSLPAFDQFIIIAH